MWTLETILACTLVPLLALIALVVGLLLHRAARTRYHPDDREDWALFFIPALCCYLTVACCAGGLWWGMWPWKAEYHQWRPVAGTVASIDSRLLAGQNSGTEQKYLVAFVGSDKQYGVLDTRAAGVHVGDQLKVECVRRWQWSGTHGYDCNYVDHVSKNRS